MPYHKTEDLPESIRNVLPPHAQEIYMSSFNNAYEEYKTARKRRNKNEDLEVVCYKVAWSAVKHKYRKDQNGQWVEKRDAETS